jgi:hypothetical protein
MRPVIDEGAISAGDRQNRQSSDTQVLTALRKQFTPTVNQESCVIVKTCGSLASVHASSHLVGSTFVAPGRVLEGALT